MAVVVIILYVLFLTVVSSFYNSTCPSAHNLYLTASVKCLAVANYTCLYDSVKKNHTQNCKGPSKSPPGEKSVINSGYFDTVNCSDERYQPRPFSSTQGTNCIFQKTLCNEEGQVIYSNGSRKIDRKCRCDYTKSYAFVSAKRIDPCSCDPVQEDCTCLIKKCNNGQKLSSDYKCVPGDEIISTCTEILHFRYGNDSEGTDLSILKEKIYINGLAYILPTATTIIVIFILTALFMGFWIYRRKWIILIIMIIGKRINNCLTACKKFKILVKLEDVTCFEHEDVEFTCEVNKKAKVVEWCKENDAISAKTNSRVEILEEDLMYILKIENVQVKDKGDYTIHFKKFKEKSKAVLHVFKEDYTFKISLLLEKVAKPVVKSIFDEEFSPEKLQTELSKRYKQIKELRKGKHINLEDMDLLYPKKVEYEIELIYHELEYVSDLENKDSELFSTWTKELEKDLTELYASAKGQQDVEILKFQPECVFVTLEITTEVNAEYDIDQIMQSTIDTSTCISQLKATKYEFNVIEKTKYEVCVLLKGMNYTGKLSDRSSPEFTSMSQGIQSSVLRLCSNIQGRTEVTVVEYKPSTPSVVVTLKLMSTYFSQIKDLLWFIEDAVNIQEENPFSNTTFHNSKYISSRNVNPSSEHFDIRLMIVLLRNLLKFDIFDDLPYETVTTKGADLSRIKYYRNKLIHMSAPGELISKSEFENVWTVLSLALNRLSKDRYAVTIDKLKKRKSAGQKVLKELKLRLKSKDLIDGDLADDDLDSNPDENKDEIMACEINKLVKEMAREKFDKEFPSSSLKQKLSSKKQVLSEYKKDKKITQTQHDLLYPEKGSPNSQTFDFSLIVRLSWELKDTMNRNGHIGEDDYLHLRILENLTDGANKMSYTEQEIGTVIETLKKLKKRSSLTYSGLNASGFIYE